MIQAVYTLIPTLEFFYSHAQIEVYAKVNTPVTVSGASCYKATLFELGKHK